MLKTCFSRLPLPWQKTQVRGMGTDMNNGKWGFQQKQKSNKLKMTSPLWPSPNLLYSMCPYCSLLMWLIIFSKYLLFQKFSNIPRSGLWLFPYSWVCLPDSILIHNAVWFLRLSFSWDTYPGTWPRSMRKVRLSLLWLLYAPGPANSHAFISITSPWKPDQIFQGWVLSSPLGTSSHTSCGLDPTVCNCLLPWLDWEQTESCLLSISPPASTALCTGWALNEHLSRWWIMWVWGEWAQKQAMWRRTMGFSSCWAY